MALNGADVLLYANTGTPGVPVWTVVGSQRDVTISEDTAVIDGSSKDGRQARVQAGRYSSTLSLDAVYVPGDAAFAALKSNFRAGTLIKVRIRESGVDKEEGNMLITSLERNHPDQEESTVSIDMQLDGSYTSL